MNGAKQHIHKWVTIWLEQLDFCLNRCKWEFFDQHIAHCILPPELFFNILIISAVCSYDMSWVTKFLDKAKFLISEPWLLLRTDPSCDCFGRISTFNMLLELLISKSKLIYFVHGLLFTFFFLRFDLEQWNRKLRKGSQFPCQYWPIAHPWLL